MGLLWLGILAPFIGALVLFIGALPFGAHWFGGIIGFVLGLIACPILITYSHAHYNERVIECKVSEKDRTEQDMRVYTENCGNFEVSDTLWRGRYESSDTYAQIKPGETQTFTVYGWRVPFLSEFPNILEVK